jgi:hypothetical protein
MKLTRVMLCLAAIAVLTLFCSPLVIAAGQGDNAVQALAEYFDYLVSGNTESATMMWTESAQERSARFGITYTDIPIRVDATSPIPRNIPLMRYHLQPAAKSADFINDAKDVKLEYNAMVEGRIVKWLYYAHQVKDYWWFTYPQDCYSAGWPIKESRYFRIHVHADKEQYLNQAALDEADAFVDRIGDSLKLDKAARNEIAARKIEYFFCDNSTTLTAITNQNTRGVLDQASNDIISTDFPHFHEITHLLINIKLKTLPLTTIPILREGIAVKFGGRWGKRASSLMDLGAYLYRQKLVSLDSILTTNGFASAAGADIAYPVAGNFSAYLLTRLGMAKYFDLYLSMSRSDNSLDTLSLPEIQSAFCKVLAKNDWTEVVTDFEAYLDSALPSMSVAVAGQESKGTVLIKGDGFTATSDRDWLNFEFSVDTMSHDGALLFGADKRLKGAHSYLWDEQNRDEPFSGYRYAVRFDQNEAGLYDYATNELLAKYIFGISPSEGYFNSTTQTVRISFRSNLVGKTVPANGDYLFLGK